MSGRAVRRDRDGDSELWWDNWNPSAVCGLTIATANAAAAAAAALVGRLLVVIVLVEEEKMRRYDATDESVKVSGGKE